MQSPILMKKLHFRTTKITFETKMCVIGFETKMCVIGLNEKVLGLNRRLAHFLRRRPIFCTVNHA